MELLSSKKALNECLFELIEESKNTLKIVSPFVDFWDAKLPRKARNWNRMIKAINAKENILEIYTKPENVNYFRKKLNIKNNCITPMDNLHAKIYINHEKALLSSLNLLYSSFNRSIDFGIVTENETEYSAVLDYCNKHIFIYNEKNSNEIKKSVEEYFSEKNITTEFDKYNRLLLKNNGDTTIRCSVEDNYDYPNYVYIYFDIYKTNNKQYYLPEDARLTIEKKYDIKISSSKRNSQYFRLNRNEYPDALLIPVINISKEKIMGVLTDVFNYME
jgi:hypothetical protein